ncbi:DUF6479 family protein [Streptomyces sp. TP-A0874]|uniref:DUF6479 family protein n=1 Tax=Streptomyces sp. TP-A0874 TaxID=549819 RepID=UPI0008530DDB|nr:DUF6479 family protein [Streptomyces sp. TP-A0874]
MYELSWETFAAERSLLIGIAPFILGILIVAALIGAVAYGRRIRSREPLPRREPQKRAGSWQTRDEYGHTTPPDHGPGHQEAEGEGEITEPPKMHSHEMHPNGRRHMPYEFGRTEEIPEEEEGHDSRSEGPPPERPKWHRGGSSHGTG